MSSFANSEDEKFSRLAAWVSLHCPEKQKRAWKNFKAPRRVERSKGDAVVAASDVRKGTKLPIPPACILTEDLVKSSAVGVAFAGVDLYTLFALFLMWQKRVPDSNWAAYLDVLPTDNESHPITYLRRPLQDGTKLKGALEAHPALLRALEAQRAS